jgi:molybdate transport system substrate-binding protein
MFKKLSLFMLVALILLAGCTTTTPAPAPTETPLPTTSVTVFAASSMNDSFKEIGREFEKANTGAVITFNFAGSQILSNQIIEGAPADVFVSANRKQMDNVIAAGLIDKEAPQLLATGTMVVILPPTNPANLTSLADLARPGIKLVLAAEGVPAGDYARVVLANLESTEGAGFKDKVLANVVSNEANVHDVREKVEMGEADAGIVYLSDTVISPDLKKLEIPAAANVKTEYFIAPLKNAPQPALAKAFVDFLLSHQGQAILLRWGLTPAD